MYQILKTIAYMHDVLGIANLALELDTILIDPDTLKITVIDFFCGCFETLCEKVDVWTRIYSPVLKIRIQQAKSTVAEDNNSITFDDVKDADIFSIGAIFRYMLFCSYPFTPDVLRKVLKNRVQPEEMIHNILQVLNEPPPKACDKAPKLSEDEFKHLYKLTKDIIMCGLEHECNTTFTEVPEGCATKNDTHEDSATVTDLTFDNVFREYKYYTKERMKGLLKQYVEDLDKKEPSVMTKDVEFVKENYIVLKELGSGGQGSTSIVQDKRTGDQYILKLFKKELDFENELTSLRKINKNGCLDTVLCFQKQVVDENNLQYGILTKVFDGVTMDKFLYDQIENNRVIPIRQLLTIMQNLLMGLEYLHNTVNIAHVDLKPEMA
jgi:serine/threonine protein kinase